MGRELRRRSDCCGRRGILQATYVLRSGAL